MFSLATDPQVDAIAGGVPVQPCYAPIRRLDTQALAAVEVQLRGPADGPFATAQALQDAARAMSQKQLLDKLKWDFARSNELTGFPALVTIDLESVTGLDEDDAEALTHSVLVIADTTLVDKPAKTLEAVRCARAQGKVVAVDGVGGRAQALSLLPLIEPDVVILHPALIRNRPDAATARTVHAVAAQVERTNAVVIADGVDTELHRRRAMGIGAEFGLGALFPAVDSPADLADEPVDAFPPLPTWNTDVASADDTPYALLAADRRSIRSRKRLLVTMSTTLEAQAAASGPETVVLGTFQHARHFTELTSARWRNLAESVAYVGVYGVDMPHAIDSGIHHAPLVADDPLVNEWTIVVLAPHFCSVLSALDLNSGTDDMDREFDYVVSYDRATAVRSAQSIMKRFTT